MDIQQEINLAIYEEFAKKGIEFAYPTQTLYVNKTAG
jgi:small-conductance mechanosensitive channel